MDFIFVIPLRESHCVRDKLQVSVMWLACYCMLAMLKRSLFFFKSHKKGSSFVMHLSGILSSSVTLGLRRYAYTCLWWDEAMVSCTWFSTTGQLVDRFSVHSSCSLSVIGDWHSRPRLPKNSLWSIQWIKTLITSRFSWTDCSLTTNILELASQQQVTV